MALTISEIECAGIKEVLQTPGAAYGGWFALDALLTSTGAGSPFLFEEPLGQSREVKVALSGLFGRFIARAYLERYFHFAIFAHITKRSFLLDGRKNIEMIRTANGDLPDWLACKPQLTSLTVAEAKGSHDPRGPGAAMARAWKQAQRINVKVNGRKVTIKRIAVATRWGAIAGPADTHISVRDPDQRGEPIKPDDEAALFVGLVRQHIANLLEPLGHPRLALALRDLQSSSDSDYRPYLSAARDALASVAVSKLLNGGAHGEFVGGIVTRGGPMSNSSLSELDQSTLRRLDLRPVFVGLERKLIHAAIDGDRAVWQQLLADRPIDAAGTIVQLGEGVHIRDA